MVVGITEDTEEMQRRHRGDCLNYDFCDCGIGGMQGTLGTIGTMKVLCCAPNELFEWTPDNKAEDYPENPLQAIRKKPVFNLEEKLKGMSVEEIKRRLG